MATLPVWWTESVRFINGTCAVKAPRLNHSRSSYIRMAPLDGNGLMQVTSYDDVLSWNSALVIMPSIMPTPAENNMAATRICFIRRTDATATETISITGASGLGARHPGLMSAVDATRGQAVTYGGNLAITTSLNNDRNIRVAGAGIASLPPADGRFDRPLSRNLRRFRARLVSRVAFMIKSFCRRRHAWLSGAFDHLAT